MKKRIVLLFAASLLLTGCAEGSNAKMPPVTVDHYDRIIYETVPVERRDVKPEIELRLDCESYSRKSYSVSRDDMEVDKVFVSVGDRVSAGDVLISCKAGDISDKIKAYETKIEKNQIMYEHYEQLNAIDQTENNDVVLEQLKRNIDLDRMYVSELRARLASYNIVAEADGVILDIAEGLEESTVGKTKNIISVIYSDGIFTTVSEKQIEFDTEEIYEAYFGATYYLMQYVSMTEDKGRYTYTFKAISDGQDFCSKETLVMNVIQPMLSGALCVPEDCVNKVDDIYVVYLLDENGFKRAREVTIGITIDGMTVIESGLSDGDEVVQNE